MTKDPHEQLFDDYLWLAKAIANSWVLPPWMMRDDLRAAAMGGLWRAVFKHDHVGTFEHYARIKIRGAIKDELRHQDLLARHERRWFRENDMQLDLVTLSDGFDLPSGDVTPEEACILRERFMPLSAVLGALPKRERYVIIEHYTKGRQFFDLAKELGVSQPRISQIHHRALERLRDGITGRTKKRTRRRRQTGKP